MKKRKFINNPLTLTKELLEGLALANQDLIYLTESGLVVNRKLSEVDRVTVVTLGGSGHEPALSGFVGDGMIDVSVPGDIFAAPSPNSCFEAIKLADRGKGVLLIVLNHEGDMLSGRMVMRLAKKEGIQVTKVVTQEDIANASRNEMHNRRGLVGCVPLYKICGAAVREGKTLEEVTTIAQDFANNMATLAVASGGATHPATGMEISSLPDNMIEIGMGQHGEGGGFFLEMKPAQEIVQLMLDRLIQDLSLKSGENVMVIINGSGATTLMELLIVFKDAYNYLKEKNISVVANYAGDLLTTQEMAGFQIFIARMNDELLKYWNVPCRTPYFTR